LSSVGSGVLGEVIIKAMDRLGTSKDPDASSETAVEGEIAHGIQAILSRDDTTAVALRSELATLLRDVDAGGTALRAALETGNEELIRELIAALADLSSDFAEMSFLLGELSSATEEIYVSLSEQGSQLRSISGQIGRQSTDVRMIREELAVIEKRTRAHALPMSGDADVPAWSDGCPYLGLMPFDEAHEVVFYGRERLTAQLVGKLEETGLLVITGASGAGKSSLLQAGLLRGGRLSGWHCAIVGP
jgi:hypothetical protein